MKSKARHLGWVPGEGPHATPLVWFIPICWKPCRTDHSGLLWKITAIIHKMAVVMWSWVHTPLSSDDCSCRHSHVSCRKQHYPGSMGFEASSILIPEGTAVSIDTCKGFWSFGYGYYECFGCFLTPFYRSLPVTFTQDCSILEARATCQSSFPREFLRLNGASEKPDSTRSLTLLFVHLTHIYWSSTRFWAKELLISTNSERFPVANLNDMKTWIEAGESKTL